MSDLISREAVLKEMDERHKNGDAITKGFIKNLPPAEPQGDLISREEMISQLEYCLANFTDYKEALEETLRKVKGTRGVEPQEWISVKDRLPEKNDCYLVTFNFVSNGNPDNGIGVVEFYDGNFYSNGFGINEDVVAWYSNPVPSPYKGDEE